MGRASIWVQQQFRLRLTNRFSRGICFNRGQLWFTFHIAQGHCRRGYRDTTFIGCTGICSGEDFVNLRQALFMVAKLQLGIGTIGNVSSLSLVTITLESLFIECTCCLSKDLNFCLGLGGIIGLGGFSEGLI